SRPHKTSFFLPSGQEFFYHFWIMFILQLVHFFSDAVRIIRWFKGGFCLKDDAPFVIMFIYIMYGNASFCISTFPYRHMNFSPVHALASIFWQQCGMDVDDLVGIGINDILGNFPKEP